MRLLWLPVGLIVLGLAPPLAADASQKQAAREAEAKPQQVPFRLTDTKHVLIRAKINGKGPFNFILDTGAPALFVGTAVCKKLGIEADKRGWGTFDRFEVEGGVVLEKARGRVEDPFQLEGMNGLGLAGVELHGIIGYTVLARFRIELDFTKDKMVWTRLDFEPPAPVGLNGKGGSVGGLDAIGGLMKFMGAMLGMKLKREVLPRGFLGMELYGRDGGLLVQNVLPKSPAAEGGLKPGDHLTHFTGKEVKSPKDVQDLAARITAGQEVEVTVQRGGERQTLRIKAGEGL